MMLLEKKLMKMCWLVEDRAAIHCTVKLLTLMMKVMDETFLALSNASSCTQEIGLTILLLFHWTAVK